MSCAGLELSRLDTTFPDLIVYNVIYRGDNITRVITHEAVSPSKSLKHSDTNAYIVYFLQSTDRIGYGQFRFGARRLTVAQPTYAGFLIGLETDTQVPAASRTAGAKLSVCDKYLLRIFRSKEHLNKNIISVELGSVQSYRETKFE